MPEKQPFDHRRHLIHDDERKPPAKPRNDGVEITKDDEALARILQEEILEEERRRGRGNTNAQNSRVSPQGYNSTVRSSPKPSADTSNDMELLRRLQREEMDIMRIHGVDDMELARRMQEEEAMDQMQADYQSQLDYARRIQEQALNANAYRQNRDFGPPQSQWSNDAGSSRGPDRNSDHEFARQMQHYEQMRSGQTSNERNSKPKAHGLSTVSRFNQEDEDARIARLMAETGQSWSDLGMSRSSGQTSEAEDARLARMIAESGQSWRDTTTSHPSNKNTQGGDARIARMLDDSGQNWGNNRSSQPSGSASEEEDARLARMIAETGQSWSDFNTKIPSPSTPNANEDARIARMLADTDRNWVAPIREISAPTEHPEPSPPVSSIEITPNNDPPPPVSQIEVVARPRESRSLSPGPVLPDSRLNTSKAPKRRSIGAGQNQEVAPRRMSPGTSQSTSAAKAVTPKSAKKTLGGLFKMGTKESKPAAKKAPDIPAPIPPRSHNSNGPLPYSTLGSHDPNGTVVDRAVQKKKLAIRKNSAVCVSCKKPAASFLIALDKKYHTECFKCAGCYQVIDSTGPFAYMTDEAGSKHPLHRACYAELYGVKCSVCKISIPAGPNGKISYVKHPFFDKEQMCPRHAKEQGRRCTGCHRFEPQSEPFADLNDAGRCVCFACCRSVVVDSDDAKPLWATVIDFFENKLHLPIWPDLREVPVLCVGYDVLNDHMIATGATHGGASQIMTRGLCLTEHQSGRKVKLAKMKFNKNNFSFENCDVENRGYTFFQVPDANKRNLESSITAILCLSGLPRDLSASVLAHEATHAWIKLHPRFDIEYPIPPQVEEGVAQLIAMLFLNEGLVPASTETYDDGGPSDEKLRQYFKFSIETDDHEIYGEGYRKAAAAYANIGVEALLSHVVLYQGFPTT